MNAVAQAQLISVLFLMFICAATAQSAQRSFVSLPHGKPVLEIGSETGLSLADRIAVQVEGLGHADYQERMTHKAALKTLVLHEGKPAHDILNTDRYRNHDDPEVGSNVNDVLDATTPDVIAAMSMMQVEALVVKGLTPGTMLKLHAGGAPVAALMIKAHLEMTMGVDVLYSLTPASTLPEACRLLALQKEDYYKVLLARIMEGVLARAIKPVAPSQAVDKGGIAYWRTHPDQARAIAALTTDPCDELRLAAVRICAYGLISLSSSDVERLLGDSNTEVARETALLRCLLENRVASELGASDDERWISGCVAALSQKDDLLAQLGAYNALTCLVDRRADLLYSFYLNTEGRAHDVIGHVLSSSLVGRLLIVREGKPDDVLLHPPASLNQVLRLWAYDVKLAGLEALVADHPEAVAPLVRRNLFVLGRSELTCFRRVTWPRVAWEAAVTLAMRDLVPVLEQQIAQHPKGVEFAPLLDALSVTEGETFMSKPFVDWYAFCAAHLDAKPLDVRAGAVGALLASGHAGAQALFARYRLGDWEDEAFGSYLKGLVLFHPYSPFLVDDTIVGRQLKADLAQGGLAFSDHVGTVRRHGSSRKSYEGGALRIPVALWAYIHNNDCNCINPIGNFLAENINPIYAPLILSWLDHNSRMSIFLIEAGAYDAREAVLRRVQQRRRDWGYCYDHDLFNYVVVYELLEALPFLEHYVKTNGSWKYKGIRTMAGIEKERYCWTSAVKSGRVNPLVLPTVRELLKHHKKEHLVEGIGQGILEDLGVSE